MIAISNLTNGRFPTDILIDSENVMHEYDCSDRCESFKEETLKEPLNKTMAEIASNY